MTRQGLVQEGETAMPRIFISYRRDDSAGHAGRLYDRLRARYGSERVFMDVTGIEAGTDFVEAIDGAVGGCDVLIAVIGPGWLDCRDSAGRQRLADPHDFVRIEVASALRRQVRVVPVLVEKAVMPSTASLPDDLRPLARRQAVELRDSRWDADVEDLILALDRIPEVPAQGRPGPAAAPRAASGHASARYPYWPWLAAGGVLLTLAAIWVVADREEAVIDARPAPAVVAPPTQGPPVESPELEAPATPAISPSPTVTARQSAPSWQASVAPKPDRERSHDDSPAVQAPQATVTPIRPSPAPTRLPPDAGTRLAPARDGQVTAHVPSGTEAPAMPVPARRAVVMVVWAQTSHRNFWSGLDAAAYSERMAELLAQTLEGRFPEGVSVRILTNRTAARRIAVSREADQARKICQESRATWIVAGHLEESFAISPADSAYWPELHLAMGRCEPLELRGVKSQLTPQTDETFPFARDLGAAMQRFVRESGRS